MEPHWQAAGLAHDLPPGVVVAGHWNGTELAIWRSISGKISAWKDRCPHRGMRLSHGFVRGETLACIYHGWVYGTSGACKHIPAHPSLRPPESIRAEAYSCLEANGVIWLAPPGFSAPLPKLPALRPVRSLTVNAEARQLRAAVPELTGDAFLSGTVRIDAQPIEICLLVQPREQVLALHALCSRGADPVPVSRWMEDLRRHAERTVS